MAPLQLGVLLIPFQLCDVAMPLDVLSSSSTAYMNGMADFGVDPALIAKGIDIEFHHIGETLDPVEHTAGFKSTPTTTCATCPKLDYLLIGGPSPEYIHSMPQALIDFIRQRAKEVKTVFTTCTGGMVAAHAGLLDGLHATTNHGAVDIAKQLFPKVNWTKEKQWVVSGDGKFWTAGGACAGMDMMAHWVIEHYGVDVAMFGFVALDYSPRGMDKELLKLPVVPATA